LYIIRWKLNQYNYMADNIRYTITADGSNAVSGIKEVGDQTINTGKVIEDVFGRKLKQVISVVAIEQATQKTAEWAQEITNTGRQLGITATAVQELNILATKLGLPADSAKSAFQAMVNAQKQALENNADIINQFVRLGVTLDDVHKPASELWDKLHSNIAAAGENVTMVQKNAAQEIFQQPYQNVALTAEAQQAAGTGLEQTAADNPANLDAQTVADISKGWAELKVDLIDLGNQLKPLVPIIISFADAVVNAVQALIDLVSFGKGWGHKVTGVAVGTGQGLVKGITGFADMGAGLVGFHPGITDWAQDQFDAMANTKGFGWLKNNKSIKHGQGLGAVAPMLLTDGGSAAVSGLGRGLVGAGSKLEGLTGSSLGLGKTGNFVINQAKDIRSFNTKVGKGISNTVSRVKEEFGPVPGSVLGPSFEQVNNTKTIMYLRKVITANKNIKGPKGQTGAEMVADILRPYLKIAQPVYTGWAAGGIAAGYANGTIPKGNQLKDQSTVYNPFPSMGLPTSGGGSLKMGGLFGVGSVGEKIVDLNQKMLYKLGQIADQTNPEKNKHVFGHRNTQHQPHIAGGI
jgi:hypothetical protein